MNVSMNLCELFDLGNILFSRQEVGDGELFALWLALMETGWWTRSMVKLFERESSWTSTHRALVWLMTDSETWSMLCLAGCVITTGYSLNSSVSAFPALEYRAELLAAGMGRKARAFSGTPIAHKSAQLRGACYSCLTHRGRKWLRLTL